MVALAPEGLKGMRERALLLLGFAGAFRRSELVALDVADIAETETGLLVTIRRSKTDPDGEDVTIAISETALCLHATLRSAGGLLESGGKLEACSHKLARQRQ